MQMTAIDKALHVVDHLVEHPEGLRPSELSRLTGYPSGTIHRLLVILARNGYVRQDATTDRYTLGFKIVEAFKAMMKGTGLLESALPHLKRLAQTTGHTANLAILRGDQVVTLECIIGDKGGLVMYSPPGTTRPAYCTGQGKVMLAGLARADVRRILSEQTFVAFTPKTIVSRDALEDHLETVARLGYAVDDEESELRCRCVAAPVFDHQGQVVASMSVSAATHSLPHDGIREVAEHVIAAANALSSALGYQPLPGANAANDAGLQSAPALA